MQKLVYIRIRTSSGLYRTKKLNCDLRQMLLFSSLTEEHLASKKTLLRGKVVIAGGMFYTVHTHLSERSLHVAIYKFKSE